MPRVGFEPTIPVFESAKTVHASDLSATLIGKNIQNKHQRGNKTLDRIKPNNKILSILLKELYR
jgi:hypothetical protein